MTHPDELLAPYVDGSLAPAELEHVQAHLRACGRCREEVELAQLARSTLSALTQVPAPEGLSSDTLAKASVTQPRSAPPRWYRIAGVVAAAAAIGLAALALPGIGSSGNEAAEPTAVQEAALEAPTPEAQGALNPSLDYDESSVKELALSTATRYRSSPAIGASRSVDEELKQGLECLRSSLPPEFKFVRGVRSTYKGIPAYIFVYVIVPSPDVTPTQVQVWVLSVEDCSVLLNTQARV
jgi:hypothetical protein